MPGRNTIDAKKPQGSEDPPKQAMRNSRRDSNLRRPDATRRHVRHAGCYSSSHEHGVRARRGRVGHGTMQRDAVVRQVRQKQFLLLRTTASAATNGAGTVRPDPALAICHRGD